MARRSEAFGPLSSRVAVLALAALLVTPRLAHAQQSVPEEDAAIDDALVEDELTEDALGEGPLAEDDLAEDELDDDDLLAGDVVVRARTEAEELARSSDSVRVIETEELRAQSSDVATIVGRSEGVNVRRTGGLGDRVDVCIHGVCGGGVRYFLDGVPLELAGFGIGLQGIPIGLTERLEIYRGMVPVRFGTDALGGAVNVARSSSYFEPRVSASLQIGSFATYRLAYDAGYRDEETGLYAGVQAFYDRSRNDYWMDVRAEDARGRLYDARIRRFNSEYEAYGIALETGFVGTSFADRLLLRVFVSEYDRGLQHGLFPENPAGEASTGEVSMGAILRYQHEITSDLSIDTFVGYVRRTIDLRDDSTSYYDWFGRVRPGLVRPPTLSELGLSTFADQTVWQDSVPARLTLAWQVAPDHRLSLSLTPEFVARHGDNRFELPSGDRDPLDVHRRLFTGISALEYLSTFLDGTLENQLFVKSYVMHAWSEQLVSVGTRTTERLTHDFGVGEGLRYLPTDWLALRASYEYATRLPEPDELFGNGVLIDANLDLVAERSHNLTLEAVVDWDDTPIGALRATAAGFARWRENLILLQPKAPPLFSYQNVRWSQVLGVEGSLTWTSPGDWVQLGGNLTYFDDRDTGEGSDTQGDRIPYQPYFYGNFAARFRAQDLFGRDVLTLEWRGRYTHAFLRAWESYGRADSKDGIGSQFEQDLALTYTVLGPPRISVVLEVTNFTDERLYDYFRAPRPSRGGSLKLSIDY